MTAEETKSDAKDATKKATTTKTVQIKADVKAAFAGWELEVDEFIVEVMLAGTDILGLDVDWKDGKTLYVKGIKTGVVQQWNKERPTEAVSPGDRVIAINGIADDPDAMLGQCRNRGKLKLLVRGQGDRAAFKKKQELAAVKGFRDAPQPLLDTKQSKPSDAKDGGAADGPVVVIETAGRSLGLDVDWCDGKSLYIRGIQAGAIHDWNQGQPSDERIQPGDTIIAVNGCAMDPQAMLHQFKTQRRLELRLRGPPPPPPLRAGMAMEVDPSPARDRKKRKR